MKMLEASQAVELHSNFHSAVHDPALWSLQWSFSDLSLWWATSCCQWAMVKRLEPWLSSCPSLSIADSLMGWGWKEPLRPPGPTHIFKQGHLEQVSQDHDLLTMTMPSEYLQEWRLHSLNNLCQCPGISILVVTALQGGSCGYTWFDAEYVNIQRCWAFAGPIASTCGWGCSFLLKTRQKNCCSFPFLKQ